MQDRAEVAAFFDLYAHCEQRGGGSERCGSAAMRHEGKPKQSSRRALALADVLAHLGLQMQSICQKKKKKLVYL